MKKEDKELLLKDLCARLPYGVRVFVAGFSVNEELKTKHIDAIMDDYDIKPYLRPMLSMTEEEVDKYYKFRTGEDRTKRLGELDAGIFDLYNENHIDYRGLIGKGLAIEVTEENNPYK